MVHGANDDGRSAATPPGVRLPTEIAHSSLTADSSSQLILPVNRTSRDGQSLAWARMLATERIVEWTNVLQAAGLRDFEIVPRGSINNGHFVGPKGRNTSWSTLVPKGMDQLIEVDLRIILSEAQDPTSPAVVNLIRRALGIEAKIEDNCVWDGMTEWDTPAPCAYLYRYDPFPLAPNSGIGIEWEIGIYRNPLCPIDQYWRRVFSADEIAWQTAQRSFLMANATTFNVDYKTDFWEVKRHQCRVGVQRLVGVMTVFLEAERLGAEAIAIKTEHLPEILDIIGSRPPHRDIVGPRIKEWLAGQDTTAHAPNLPAVTGNLSLPPETPVNVLSALETGERKGHVTLEPPQPSALFARIERLRAELARRIN